MRIWVFGSDMIAYSSMRIFVTWLWRREIAVEAAVNSSWPVSGIGSLLAYNAVGSANFRTMRFAQMHTKV
jgi:hypothetical protein